MMISTFQTVPEGTVIIEFPEKGLSAGIGR